MSFAGPKPRFDLSRPWATFAARLRVLIRQEELGLITLSVVAGAVAGGGVTLLSNAARLLHIALFDLDERGSVSALAELSQPWHAALPMFGGLLLGVVGRSTRSRPTPCMAAECPSSTVW